MGKDKSKRLIEKIALVSFVENSGVSFEEGFFEWGPEEPADVTYRGVGYQVVSSDFEFQANMGQNNFSSSSRGPEELFNDLVLEPINKKRKYGGAARGLTLLVNARRRFSAPGHIIASQLNKRSDTDFDIGFDEIYLVSLHLNIKIYPKR